MELLLLNLTKTLLDAVAAEADAESDAYALPARCTSFSWQTLFGTDPDSITVQILGSLNAVDYYVIDSSTTVTGQIKTLNTNVTHIKAKISAVSGGADVSVLLTPKDI